MAIKVQRALDEFLMENGFTIRHAPSHVQKFTYGKAWTDPKIDGEVYPIMFVKKAGKWYCYLLGLLLPRIPEPAELAVVLGQLETFGVK